MDNLLTQVSDIRDMKIQVDGMKAIKSIAKAEDNHLNISSPNISSKSYEIEIGRTFDMRG